MKLKVSMNLNALSSIVGFLFVLMSFSSSAALVGRDLDGNSSTFEAYYDDILDITWLADANLASSNKFGIGGINTDGSMSWNEAMNWVAGMNNQSYFGFDAWRLPSIVGSGGSEILFLFSEYFGRTQTSNLTTTSSGFSFSSSTSEDESAFSNIQNLVGYWSEDAAGANAYAFASSDLSQGLIPKSFESYFYAWAVADGDVFGRANATVVPVPAAVWLFGSALLGLMGLARKK